MVFGKLLSSILVDELMVRQPVDGAALGANVTRRVPVRDEIGEALVDLVLEPAEGSSPVKRGGQTSSRPPRSLMPSAKSAMS